MTSTRCLLRVLLITVIVMALAVESTPVRQSQATALGPEQLLNLPMRKVRIITGLASLFGAWNARNRVYRDARIVQGERNTYYDGLRDEAREQLHTPDGIKTYNALDQTRANTYVRLVQNIENRRTFASELIEDEKREARGAFHRRVRDTLVTALVQSKGGKELLGKVQESLNDFAERIGEVRAALEKGSPDLALDRLASKVTDIPQLREQLKVLGGEAAAALDRQLNGLLTKANTIREGGVGAADEALAAVNAMSAELQVQVNTDRRIRSSSDEAGNPVEISVPGGGGTEASANAIAAALTRLVQDQNPALDPASRPQMRQRVADLIQKDTLDRNREIRTALGHDIVTCKAESESVYAQAATMLGQTPMVPEGEVQFFVCYLKPQDNPIYAFIVESKAEEDEEGAPWDEENTTITTAPGATTTTTIPPGVYTGSFADSENTLLAVWIDDPSVAENTITIRVEERNIISIEYMTRHTGQVWDCDGETVVEAETDPQQMALRIPYIIEYEIRTAYGNDQGEAARCAASNFLDCDISGLYSCQDEVSPMWTDTMEDTFTIRFTDDHFIGAILDGGILFAAYRSG